MTILYQDDAIAVINKPSGLASQSTKKGNDAITDEFPEGWQPIHRLDQRVSGILLIGKTPESTSILNDAFANRQVAKHYKAIVATAPHKSADTLTHWLLKDGKQQKVKAYNHPATNAQKAILSYSVIQSSLRYHLLEIELATGRMHQIRAQLAAIGSPIVGDLKYGYPRSSPDGSIFLQSYRLGFIHPFTKEQLQFEIKMPEIWHKYGF